MKKHIFFVLAAALFVMLPTPLLAGTYYVSTTGSDANDGSFSAPWLTIQHAVDSVGPGDTIYVRTGIYNELVNFNNSGSAAGGYITLQNYDGETPVIDGTALSGSDPGLIKIEDKHHIIVSGLELRNLTTSNKSTTPAGIWLLGTSHHIELNNNLVHHIENNATGGNAHGIAAYGYSSSSSINNLVIKGNEVRNCILGWSESMVLNGNVENFIVENNIVHDNDNIGIDFIGHEGTCSDPCLDQARDGICTGNLVYNIDSLPNPAYGGERSADGIYVDGGKRINIEKNIVHHCNIGVEIASEHRNKGTSNIIVRNNIIYNTHCGGIFIGGYASNKGWARDCNIVNNTLYNNDTDNCGWGGEIVMQYHCSENIFKNNLVYAGSNRLFICNENTTCSNNTFNYNLYYGSAGQWKWNNVTYSTFSSYKSASAQDANTLTADPKFVDAPNQDFHIRFDSPCINAADPSLDYTSQTDIDAEPREMSGRVDIGADELSQKQADFTRNGLVNMDDYAVLAGSWRAESGDPHWYVLCDLFEDGLIDSEDLREFVAEWLWKAAWY
jgi:parallel beta-helix repeat protein